MSDYLCGLEMIAKRFEEMQVELLDLREYAAATLIDRDPASHAFLLELAQAHREEDLVRMPQIKQYRAVLTELIEHLQVFLCRDDLTANARAALGTWRYEAAAKLVGIDPDHYQAHRTPVLAEAS